jgi:hypothetical protein
MCDDCTEQIQQGRPTKGGKPTLIWSKHNSCNFLLVVLGGLVVIVLALDQSFASSNPAEDDGFLWAIKIRSTTSLGEEVNPSVPISFDFFLNINNPAEYERDISFSKFKDFFVRFSCLLLTVCLSDWYLPESSGG